MKTRIVSGIIGFLLLLSIVIIGGYILDFAILLISLIGVYEFNKAIRKINNLKHLSVFNYLLAFALFISVKAPVISLQVIIYFYITSLLCMIVLREDIKPQDISITMFGGMYVPFFLYHIYLLNGNILIWLIFIIAFSTDTFALFVGKAIGKRKLAPKLSPKKTIEGSIGGILGSLIVTLIFVYYFKIGNMFGFAILSIITSVMSQIGDLTASRIKRIASVKDYGKIMPGHGGVLDRFDSILFTAPIVYYYIVFFLS